MGKHISDITLDELKAELTRLYGEETIDADKVNEVKNLIAQKEVTKGQLETEIKELQKEQQQAENEGRLDLHAEVTRKLKATEAQLAELKQSEESKQLTQLEQEEIKESFQLPKDYSELFDDERANEEISSLIGQVMDQYGEYMNSKLEEKDLEFGERLQVALADKDEEISSISMDLERTVDEHNETLEELKRLETKNEKLQEELESTENRNLLLIHENDKINTENQQYRIELKDAESKRDAAVRENESLKAQMAEMEHHYRSQRPKPDGFKLNLTSDMEDKPLRSSEEIALEGQRYRGKVELQMPQLKEYPTPASDHTDVAENTTADETRIITVDEEAEISEGEQGSNFPSTESQGTDQVGPSDTGAYEVDKARYATRQELQAVKDDLHSFKRSLDDQFGTTFVKAG